MPDANIVVPRATSPSWTRRASAAARRGRTSRRPSPTSPRARRPNDEVFIVLIGHGSFDGRRRAFNLPGPDLTAADYATLLDKLSAQRVAFVNTASSSGAFLPAARRPRAAPSSRRRRPAASATKRGFARVLRRGLRATTPPTAIATATCRCSKRSSTRRRRCSRRIEQDGLHPAPSTRRSTTAARASWRRRCSSRRTRARRRPQVDISDPALRALRRRARRARAADRRAAAAERRRWIRRGTTRRWRSC